MQTPDITLYTLRAPNGLKISIVFEELGIPYKVRTVSIEKREHKEPWFLKINPNGRLPAITDHSRGDFNVFESGAIMIYLCEHYDPEGKLLPKDPNYRSQVLQWLMFQMSGIGPMQGQATHFLRYAPEKIPHGIQRYTDETKRLYTVLNDALEGKEYLVGNVFTIADAAIYPWVRIHFWSGIPSIDALPNLKTWVERIDARPGTRRGLDVPVPDSINEFKNSPERWDEFAQVGKNLVKQQFEESQKYNW